MQDLSLKSLDSNPASINLNYNKIQKYRSYTGGFLSLCYIIVGLFIFVFKLKDLVYRNQLTYEQIVTKSDDKIPLNISSGKFRLHFLQINQQGAHRIKFTDQFQKGIIVYIVEYNVYIVNQAREYKVRKFPMVECPKQQYGDQSEYYFCSPYGLNNLNFTIFGRVDFSHPYHLNDSNPYRQYSFVVQQCNQSLEDKCKKYKDNLLPFFQFFNDKIFPNKISHEETIVKSLQGRNIQSRSPMHINQTIDFQLDFQKIIVRTQNSILPSIFNQENEDYQINETWYFDEQINQFYSIKYSPETMLNVQIRRSVYTREYVRKYKKLDFVLAQIFGLLSLFSGIIFFFYRGYNEYSLEQKIRKDLGLPYDKNVNILQYYRYQIKKCLYKWLPCCFKNNEKYLQQKKSLLKMSKKLDVSTLKHQNLHRRFIQYT